MYPYCVKNGCICLKCYDSYNGTCTRCSDRCPIDSCVLFCDHFNRDRQR